MNKDMFEIMGEGYPALSDLMGEICAAAGSFGRDRIKKCIERFVTESDRARVEAAIADIDRSLAKLPLSPAEFEDFLNYVLKSEAEVRTLLTTLRSGLQEGLAAKTK